MWWCGTSTRRPRLACGRDRLTEGRPLTGESSHQDPDPRYFVEAAARGVRLLQAVAAADGPVSLNDLVGRLGLTKPTVYRLIRTMESLGTIRVDQNSGYLPGLALIPLGQAALRSTNLTGLLQPHLDEIAGRVEETVVAAVLEGAEIVYLAVREGEQVLTTRTRVGSRLPAYCTATGHALLALLEEKDVRARLARCAFTAQTPNTLTSVSDLLRRLDEVRAAGFAINDEELAAGHRSVAAAIRDHSGGPVAALSISVPAARVSREDLIGYGANVLRPIVDEISAAIDFDVDEALRR